ncbi:MAG: sigma-70 family RNA polymerase sigma factor [Lachnospiraceae bacterium]|nr:sigma-70 family RNA polymerase sigma factor [Lachnospiraceae bacterium]
MLCDLVEKAQKSDDAAMMELIDKFSLLFKKYAKKLNYEDAYEDIMLYFIELVKTFNLNKLSCQKDEVIVSYINVSIRNFYNKKVQKVIEGKREILFSDLSEEQAYYAEMQTAKEDVEDIFIKFGMENLLNENECWVIYLIYSEGYTTADIARLTNKSRQAVNQLKHRALDKMKKCVYYVA